MALAQAGRDGKKAKHSLFGAKATNDDRGSAPIGYRPGEGLFFPRLFPTGKRLPPAGRR